MKKILLIIIDGLGDRPISKLGRKTPLEAAKTPNLDWLAKKGICGLVLPFLFPWEKEPSSEGSHLALFGYKDYFLGRGPYEAAGIGMEMKEGDLALRVNFATIDKNLKVIDRRAGRIEKTQPLINALKGIEIRGLRSPHHPPAKGGPLVKFILKKSYGHRAVLILRGRNLSDKISDSDPYQTGLEIKNVVAKNKSPKAIFTADILNKFLFQTYQILKDHSLNKKREEKGQLSANCILTRGAGFFKKSPSFKKKYGLFAGCIAGGNLYKGIAKVLGMDLIKIKGATGFANTNLKGKILAAKDAKYDFIFLHIKATDTFSHDGDFVGKKEFIEKIDKNIKPLLNLKNTLIAVTADHSTCSDLKRHCTEPIPILIYGKGQDSVKEFSEKACKLGKLGKFPQLELMPKILKYAKES